MLRRLGFLSAQHPVAVIVTWVILVTTLGVAALTGVFNGQTLFDRMVTSSPSVPSQSKDADDLLAGSDNGEATIIGVVEGLDLTDADVVKTTIDMADELKDADGVKDVVTPAGLPAEALSAEPKLAGLVSSNEDKPGFLVLVTVEDNDEVIASLTEKMEGYGEAFAADGATLQVASETGVNEQVIHQASEDLEKGELISLPVALLVLLLVFGGFLAAGMPLIGAIVSIVAGLGALYGVSFVMDIDTSVLNVLTIIGLGLSIDYGLLMISRYRETLRAYPESDTKSVKLAVVDTVSTAGRTVIFSGVTIAICTSALALFPASIMRSVAVSAAAVILLAVIASVTLLPSLFRLFGYKLIHPSPLRKVPGLGKLLDTLGDTAPEEGVFSRLAGWIQKAPAIVAILGIGLLTVLGSGLLSLNVTAYGSPFLAHSSGQIAVFDDLEDNYPSFAVSDVTTVVQDDTTTDSVSGTMEDLGFTDVTVIPADGDIPASVTGNFSSSQESDPQTAVTELRDNLSPPDALVTGDTARDMDFNNGLLEAAPWVAGVIILTTFILLFLLSGSIFIPLKAIVLSALSLGAAVGVVTWGFEGGHLAGLLDFDASEISGISPIILVFILVFGFGLAMDYEVFLVARIKEEYEKSNDAKAAIRAGLQGSGRIITSAGLIIVLVFLGFTLGDLLMIKEIGVALAVAVLVDMLLVRCIIVPAVMTIAGRGAWWAPKWMKVIYNKFKIEH